MELLLSGMSTKTICDILKIEELPRPLIVYLFCSPKLDLTLRCLPRAGGALDQDYQDIIDFQIIEKRIRSWIQRQQLLEKRKK